MTQTANFNISISLCSGIIRHLFIYSNAIDAAERAGAFSVQLFISVINEDEQLTTLYVWCFVFSIYDLLKTTVRSRIYIWWDVSEVTVGFSKIMAIEMSIETYE